MRLLALALAFSLCGTPCQGQENLTWHADLDAARTLAAEQKKPLLLLFRCER